MSTATEITRLQTARNTIRDKLIDLGLASSTAKIDALATAVDGIENKGAISASVQEGETYTIPKGYHNGSGTVSGVAGGGNYSLQSKTITPTKNQQSVTADQGFYGLSDVTVKAIPDAYQNVSGVTAAAGDVLANKVIVDAAGNSVAGTMTNNGAVTKTLDTATDNQSYTIPAGYHNGSGKVSITLETKTATPTESAQTISPTSGKVLSSVSVGAIPSDYVSAKNTIREITDDALLTENQATVDELLEGMFLWGYSDEAGNRGVIKFTGTMPNNGAVSGRLNTTTTDYVVPQGYHNGEGRVVISLQTKNVTPTESAQTVSPDSNYVLKSVSVGAIPNEYISANYAIQYVKLDYSSGTSAYGEATDLLSGKTLWGWDEDNDTLLKIRGTMANNGAVAATIDGLTTTSYTIPAGYHNGSGTVSLTDDIETALAAI